MRISYVRKAVPLDFSIPPLTLLTQRETNPPKTPMGRHVFINLRIRDQFEIGLEVRRHLHALKERDELGDFWVVA